ncbi:MAG TPA: hemerythrin domain-containing protein, partial [Kofleriaceae bacterium]
RRRSPMTVEPKDVSTRELITSVIARHHRYLHRALPFLDELAAKVARVHGSREPSLAEVSRLVTELVVTFKAHLKEEEEMLFPALLAERPGDATVQLAAMRNDHDQVGALLEKVRRAAADFVAPEWACNSYRTLMKELAELEADTLRHVHIENHVLLPRFVG